MTGPAMTHPRRVTAAALAALAALAVLPTCTSTRDDDPAPDTGGRLTRLPEPGPALGKNLMLGLALAKNLHHKADVYLKEARVEDAVTAVRKILDIKFPADAPEGEEVVLDARARLAKLLVTQGKLDQAARVVDDGIAGTRRQSFFLANLYTVRGEVLEARAALAEDRDAAGAREARRKAIAAYDRAIAIDKALLDQVSPEAGDQPAGAAGGAGDRP